MLRPNGNVHIGTPAGLMENSRPGPQQKAIHMVYFERLSKDFATLPGILCGSIALPVELIEET